MINVKVLDIRADLGFGGSTRRGTVTVTAVVRSEELGRMEIAVQVPKQRDDDGTAQEARAALQRFSLQLAEALTQPLAFE
jgi:hypothetical protein